MVRNKTLSALPKRFRRYFTTEFKKQRILFGGHAHEWPAPPESGLMQALRVTLLMSSVALAAELLFG